MRAALIRAAVSSAVAAAVGSAPLVGFAQSLRLDTRLQPSAATVPAIIVPAPTIALRIAPSLSPARLPTIPVPPAPSPGKAGDAQPLIAQVRINEQDKGEHALYLLGQDEFLVPRAALDQWARVPADVPAVTIDGEPHVSLKSLSFAKTRFDEATLVLRIDFPPEAFAPQVYAFRQSERPAPTPGESLSAMVNYQLGAGGSSSGGSEAVNATLEPSLNYRGWLLRGQTFHTNADGATTSVRGLTTLTRDDPLMRTRVTIGDYTTGLTELGGGTVLGGIAFARAFELDPYFVRQPTAAFRTQVDTPSQVDVYVGGTRIDRRVVAPGPVELGNLTYLTGQRDVRVVIRDVFGREREITFPFYFADRGLAPGLHDFGYALGAVRRNMATESSDYGQLAFSGSHRVGLTDAITAGAVAEATRDLASGGPTVTLRSDTLGVLSLAALASRRNGVAGSRSGAAGAVAYSYQRGPASAFASLRRSTRPFVSLASLTGSGPPLADYNVSLGWSIAPFGSLSASWRESRTRDEQVSRSASVGYSLPVGREWVFQAIFRRSTGAFDGREFFASLQYMPSQDFTSFASVRDDGQSRTGSLQVANLLPEGEGVGYRLTAEASDTPDGTRRVLTPDVTWNGRRVRLQASATNLSGAGIPGTTLYSASLSGALAYVGGVVGLSRPIDDSFAVARVEPPVPGVRVYLNQQEMGRTNDDGTLFLPRIVSYVENSVSIDDRDIPIERGIDRKEKTVVPYFRSGTMLGFEAPLQRSVSGKLNVREGARLKPVEFALVTVVAAGKSVEVPTGRDGDFYIENLPEGVYAASVELAGRTCRFTLRVPRSDEPVVRLPDVTVCDER